MRVLAVFCPILLACAILPLDAVLKAEDTNRMKIQVYGGLRWGRFDEINRWNALDVGDQHSEGLKPNPLDRGYMVGAGLRIPFVSGHFLLLDGTYEGYSGNGRSQINSATGENLGVHDYPLYNVRNIPVSISFLLHAALGPFDLNAGPGMGYQWTRYRVEYPSYDASSPTGAEMYYTGSSPLYTATGEILFTLLDRLALSFPVGYRYSKVKRLELESWKPGDAHPEDDVLRNPEGDPIPLDLSGFSIGVRLTFR